MILPPPPPNSHNLRNKIRLRYADLKNGWMIHNHQSNHDITLTDVSLEDHVCSFLAK